MSDIEQVDFHYNGVEYTAKLKMVKKYHVKARGYVWAKESKEMKQVEQMLTNQQQLLGLDTYWTVKGEHPSMDKLWSKYNRAEVKNMKEVLIKAIDALGFGDDVYSMLFKRTAGCSCGCSPGFVVLDWTDGYGTAIYVYPKAEAFSQTSWKNR